MQIPSTDPTYSIPTSVVGQLGTLNSVVRTLQA